MEHVRARAIFDDPRLPDRFWDKVIPEPNTGCWLWLGALNESGYGRIWSRSEGGGRGRALRAHRVAYEALVGPIGPGMHVDHVRDRGCGNRACCNPDHLEPVTPQVNTLRGGSLSAARARRDVCPEGHPYDQLMDGDRPCRRCRKCRNAQRRARLAAKKAAGAQS